MKFSDKIHIFLYERVAIGLEKRADLQFSYWRNQMLEEAHRLRWQAELIRRGIR